MELTRAASRMVQTFGKIYSAQVMTSLMTRAEEITRAGRFTHIAPVQILAAMEELAGVADPMIPDYPALAAEEPTSQNSDSRDSAEVAGC